MVSSSVVSGDSSSFSSTLSTLDSTLSGLSGSWKGASYENFNSQVSDFVSEFSGTITGQLGVFASACDLYEKYKSTKASLNSVRQQASANTDSEQASYYNSQISSYENQLNSLKAEIQAALSSASSEKLDATSMSGIAFSGGKNWADDSNFTYYNQGAGWSDYRYSAGGSNTMGASGCGPCSAAMVMASFGKDVTPDDAANWSADHGYHVSSGTDHEFFTAYGDALNVPCSQMSPSSENIASSLSQGGLVVLSMAPGDFTSRGHFIVARGYNSETNEVLIADPNHESNCHWWDLDRVSSQAKNGWAYYEPASV